MLMNDIPDVKTGNDINDKLILDYHKTRTMLNDSKVNSYKFFNQQWLLKQVCDNLGVKLLQTYALDNPEFVKGRPEANTKWLDAISPYPISFTRQLREVEHLEDVRAPLRHPNEQGHKLIAKNVVAYLQQGIMK